MGLLKKYLLEAIRDMQKNHVKICFFGDLSALSPELQELAAEASKESEVYTDSQVNMCINYGSRDEMVRAMKKMAADRDAGKFSAADISEETFGEYLDTAGIPDPDLLIRTSGEQRLSNYLLWQLAYSEFYFTDIHWPDFSKEELEKAVLAYNKRDRRYGGVREE